MGKQINVYSDSAGLKYRSNIERTVGRIEDVV